MKFLVAYIGRRTIFSLVVAAACLAILDMAGVAVIFPYLSAIAKDAPAAGQGALGSVYHGLGVSSRQEFVLRVSLVLGAFFVVKFGVAYAVNRIKFQTNARITAHLSNDLFGILLRTDYSFLANHSVSEMTGIINAETIHATLCLEAWVTIATEALFLVLIFIAIVTVNAKLATVLLVAMVIVTAALYLGVVRRTSRLGAQQTRIHLRQYRFLFGVVNALKDIKILGLERASEIEHTELNTAYASAISSFNIYQTLPRSIIELLVMIGLLSTVVVLVTSQTELQAAIPVIGFLAVAALRIIPSYSRIINSYSSYNYYKPSLGVVQRLHRDLGNGQVLLRSEPRAFDKILEIRDLHFAHGQVPVLAGITISIRKGQSVGIVGLSGSGKTTFLDILAGLRRADGGEFLLDGKAFDPHAVDTLRRLLGYVPQNVTLIDESIGFNVSFERQPNAERLWQVARAARIEDFIASLPGGIETLVGENGVRVSGGQKQRIGIARALYRDPQILIFDEATSSVDNVTEQELVTEIAALSQTKTLIIVAHRLTTVARCDEIHVFDRGRVVGSGTHELLIDTCQAYRLLYKAQDTAGGAAPSPARVV